MNININTNLEQTLNTLASDRSMTPETYIEGYIESHLTSQYKQIIINKIQNETLDNIVAIDSVITEKKAEIKIAYDLANPPIGVIDSGESTSTPNII